VRVDWRDPVAMGRVGFHRTWFNFGGINRPVTLRAIGHSQIEAPMLRTQLARSGDGSLQAVVTVTAVVHNYARTRPVALAGTFSHAGQHFDLSFPSTEIRQGTSGTVRSTVTIPNPALWTPGSPNLYDLVLTVPRESAFQARVGLRELQWSPGHLLLNGRPLVLRGASLQEDAPNHGDALTPADQDQLVADLKAIGANATRNTRSTAGCSPAWTPLGSSCGREWARSIPPAIGRRALRRCCAAPSAACGQPCAKSSFTRP
jgi:beta-galactosidase/beta-glucuronidase